jgi:hypothetical protein
MKWKWWQNEKRCTGTQKEGSGTSETGYKRTERTTQGIRA